jgi:hypothetical protein
VIAAAEMKLTVNQDFFRNQSIRRATSFAARWLLLCFSSELVLRFEL